MKVLQQVKWEQKQFWRNPPAAVLMYSSDTAAMPEHDPADGVPVPRITCLFFFCWPRAKDANTKKKTNPSLSVFMMVTL